jgi:hypothetical protein
MFVIGRPRVPQITLPCYSILFTIGKLRKADPASLSIQCLKTRSQTPACNNLVSEPSFAMSDQRLEQLEKEVGSLNTGQEKMMKQMDEMFVALSNCLEHVAACVGGQEEILETAHLHETKGAKIVASARNKAVWLCPN